MRSEARDVKLLAWIAAICQQIIMTRDKQSKQDDKADRLAEALRRNLRRRKKTGVDGSTAPNDLDRA